MRPLLKTVICVCVSILLLSSSVSTKERETLFLHVSLPYVNSFYLQPENEPDSKANTGFWGISVGLAYYHSKTQFVNLSASAVMDIFLPVPAPIDFIGGQEFMTSTYTSLSNNHVFESFTLGYGMCYSSNVWEYRYYDDFDPPPPTREPAMDRSNALGFVFPAYYLWREQFSVGLIYRPTLIRFGSETELKYEHLITIDFVWKIGLN